MAQVEDITLNVPDVSCEHCVKTIDGAVGALPGVEMVRTDIPTKTVQVRFEPDKVSLQQIETTLDDAGYSVAK